MDIIIASNNKHKVVEIKDILKDKFDTMFTLIDKGLNVDVEENGTSFYENAYIKAKTISDLSGYPALADDSGLCVNALEGAPGIFSARYAKTPCDDNANNELLLKNLESFKDRSAKFVCVVVLYYPDGKVIFGEGEAEGYILTSPQGDNGFGYDPLFLSAELNKSFAILTSEEKNNISHRKKALKNLLSKIT